MYGQQAVIVETTGKNEVVSMQAMKALWGVVT